MPLPPGWPGGSDGASARRGGIGAAPVIRRAAAACRPAAIGRAAPCARGAAAGGGVDRLRRAARRLDRVEAAAVAGDDAVELGQRIDLLDDDAAHLRGAFGGLLRQLEDALAQFGARRLHLALHLGAICRMPCTSR